MTERQKKTIKIIISKLEEWSNVIETRNSENLEGSVFLQVVWARYGRIEDHCTEYEIDGDGWIRDEERLY